MRVTALLLSWFPLLLKRRNNRKVLFFSIAEISFLWYLMNPPHTKKKHPVVFNTVMISPYILAHQLFTLYFFTHEWFTLYSFLVYLPSHLSPRHPTPPPPPPSTWETEMQSLWFRALISVPSARVIISAVAVARYPNSDEYAGPPLCWSEFTWIC